MKPNNNNNKNIFTVILSLFLYFSIMMLFFTMSTYYFLGIQYENAQNNTQIESETPTETENPENSEKFPENNVEMKEQDILLVIEKNSSYKIYVDVETRNMYLKTNTYKEDTFVMMYDGDKPKIYKGIINNETYEEFCKKQETAN